MDEATMKNKFLTFNKVDINARAIWSSNYILIYKTIYLIDRICFLVYYISMFYGFHENMQTYKPSKLPGMCF